MMTGCEFDEILHVPDFRQLTAAHRVSTPANWNQGEDVIIVPTVIDEEPRGTVPEGLQTLKSHLRIVKPPGI